MAFMPSPYPPTSPTSKTCACWRAPPPERFGGIDVSINNAAGIGLVGPFADVPMESHRRVVETNLFGSMNGTHAVLP